MGWYLLCTALLLSISLLRPHLPLFPLRACLCCTLPLPSTAPPSWSHLETEQVLWRDRGWLRKVSQPRLMTPAPFSAHYAETVSLQQQPGWSQMRTGNITEFEAGGGHTGGHLQPLEIDTLSTWCNVYILFPNTHIFQFINYNYIYIYATIVSHYIQYYSHRRNAFSYLFLFFSFSASLRPLMDS